MSYIKKLNHLRRKNNDVSSTNDCVPSSLDSSISNSSNNKTKIAASIDTPWLTKASGRSYNNSTGHASLIVEKSKQIISHATRSKVCKEYRAGHSKSDHDCWENFFGSSKFMEPDMGLQLVLENPLLDKENIRDANYCYESNGESNDNDDFSGYRHPEINAALNTVLYVGLGTTALGLVICFIGTGEKGFLSPELKLVGPSLLCAGLFCCLIRIFLCSCLCHRCDNCEWKPCPVEIVGKDSLKTDQQLSSSKQEQPTTSLLPRSPSTDQLIKKTIATRTSDEPSLSTSFEPGKGHELLLVPSQLLK